MLINQTKGFVDATYSISNVFEIFPREDLFKYENRGNIDYMERVNNGMIREGIIEDGYKQGLWKTEAWVIQEQTNQLSKKYTHREEYFQNGLQDSTYTIYTPHGEILYRTIFNKGIGVEKDYYDNGQLYYEVAKKDGYFTDTLKLYDKEGYLMEKLFYMKDSLIYHEKIDENGLSTIIKK
jgi:antitoxin component YwqK of YwqJK toxin-antitoxin module